YCQFPPEHSGLWRVVALTWQRHGRKWLSCEGAFAGALGRRGMLRTLKQIKLLLAEKEGVTLIEYCLIAALIAIVSLIILTAVGTEVSAVFSKINSALSSAAS